VGVPFVVADLVGRAHAEPRDVEGVKEISASATAARIARWYSPLISIDTGVAELVEEGLQGGAVAVR
jgi:hypothetical protein